MAQFMSATFDGSIHGIFSTLGRLCAATPVTMGRPKPTSDSMVYNDTERNDRQVWNDVLSVLSVEDRRIATELR